MGDRDQRLDGTDLLTLDTLNFLCELLSTVTVSASSSDFDNQAARVSRARNQLLAAVKYFDAD
jgi:hypothetical protein